MYLAVGSSELQYRIFNYENDISREFNEKFNIDISSSSFVTNSSSSNQPENSNAGLTAVTNLFSSHTSTNTKSNFNFKSGSGLTRDQIILMHQNLKYPLYKPFWKVVSRADSSTAARAVVKELTEPFEIERKKQNPGIQYSLVPEDINDTSSLDSFYFEKQWFCHHLNHFSNFSRVQKFLSAPNADQVLRFLLLLRVCGALTANIITDAGPEFMNLKIFLFITQLMLAHWVSAGQAHWSNGKNEKRI